MLNVAMRPADKCLAVGAQMTTTETSDSRAEDGAPEEKLPGSPGRFGTRHVQVFLMFLGMMIAYALRVILSVAVVAMTKPETANPDFKAYNWSSSEQSLVLSSFFWGYIVTQVPFGYLANAWSAQKLLSGGLFFCGLLSIVIPLVVDQGGWIIVCVCRVGMGLSQGCVLPGIQTLLARWVPPSERARLGTFAYAGGQLGTVLTMPISGQLAASSLGWPSIFYVFGALGIGWAGLFLTLGSDEPESHSKISEAEKRYIRESLGKTVGSQDEKERLRTPWKEIFTSLPMWALIIVHCGQNWGFWLLLTEIPTYMSEIVGYSIKENGLISALPYLTMWILSFPASWFSDLALRRGAPRGAIRKVSNTVAHWGPALALLALCFVDVANKSVPVTLLIIAVGLNAGAICGFQINHIDLSPNFAGTMMSITNCVASIIAIIAPIICGEIVKEQTNVEQWHIVFYISALIYFLGNLVFIVFGSGEVQWWNDPASAPIEMSGKRSYQINTISTAYNPNNMTLKQIKSSEAS
ncbi:putative inorganic phosphate cotransporter isoform X1 [Nasonia vitripennis]|uniref:Putative inorganic phosphate cotransporter n=2 Tax=Nasonia vitripennis TaxID=7425 RepID=A0A7M7GBS4_NASVI|nr:putative inorganic phosphate cotransporter isoform X1 [Nasonia vitripennis]